MLERLRGLRYLIQDVLYVLGRIPRALASGLGAFWFGLALETRQRLAVATGTVLVIAVLWLIAVPALPCSLPAGDECAPEDDAIALVPGDALAYIHLNADPETDQYEEAAGLASRVPLIADQVIGRLLVNVPGAGGAAVDLRRDVLPWFGGEGAVVIVPAGGTAEQVQLLEVEDDEQAERYAKGIALGGVDESRFRGVEVRTDSRGLANTIVEGFVVIGRPQGVRDVIETATGAEGARSLADSDQAEEALDALPEFRLAEAYVSQEGVRDLSGPGGPLETVASFINPGASAGAAVALVAHEDGLGIEAHSVIDEERAKASPGFFAAFPEFSPSLAGDLPADSLAYVGTGDPQRVFRSLLSQASVEEPGLAAAVADLGASLRELGDIDLQRQLLPSLGDETAIALAPAPRRRARGEEAQPGIAPPAPPEGLSSPESIVPAEAAPIVELLASGVDTDEARSALARLQGPIARAVQPESGLQAPVFSERKIGDVTAQSLRVSPTVNLTYVLLDSLLVAATDPAGVARIAAGGDSLGDDDAFEHATGDLPGSPSLLGYLGLEGLVRLGESAGLAEDPAYATFAPEIRRLDALAFAVSAGDDELVTEARVVVEEPEEDAGDGGGPATGELGD